MADEMRRLTVIVVLVNILLDIRTMMPGEVRAKLSQLTDQLRGVLDWTESEDAYEVKARGMR